MIVTAIIGGIVAAEASELSENGVIAFECGALETNATSTDTSILSPAVLTTILFELECIIVLTIMQDSSIISSLVVGMTYYGMTSIECLLLG